ncbi:MAG: TlpA family protein disulfide reductase [Tannerella sp.]|nr:TlpA family protein disulfide reductase [Tannerella sp.]
MKTKIIILTSLLYIASVRHAAAQATSASDLVTIGHTMPAFTIVSDDGTQIPSARFGGKVILINFFATWCPPCQTELAEMEKTLWPEYRDRDDFALLVIGREHSDAELKPYRDKKGFSFPLYPDRDRHIFASFATQDIPRSYLIDRNGKIIFATKGYTKREFDNLIKAIDRALLQGTSKNSEFKACEELKAEFTCRK